jgi:hypothetical protein
MEVKVGAKSTRRTFAKRDQFGPEKIYFSDCMLDDREPEPAGYEGLVDVHMVPRCFRWNQNWGKRSLPATK